MSNQEIKSTNHLAKEQELEDALENDLKEINMILEHDEPQLDGVIDKQIIAAAHHSSKVKSKPKIYRYSGWRRLSLPLYVATGFSLSIFAFNSLWQPPGYIIEDTQAESTHIEVSLDSVNVEAKMAQSKRVKHELPELSVPEELPGVVTDAPIAQDGNGLTLEEGNVSNQEFLYTGTQTSIATYPEKEAWARKIITHMREGEIEQARNELTRFKKVYPTYPIEEQIKGLNY